MRQHSPVLTLVFAALLSGSLDAQDVKKATKPPSVEDQLKRAMPGAEHQKLASYAGAWEVEVRMGSRAGVAYQGTADNRMIVGGRFLEIQYAAKGNSGATEGTFILGFDPRHERFALIAMDNFGTYFVTSQGKRNEATGKIKLLGADDDPMMKALGFTKEFAHVVDFRNADEFAIEVRLIDTRTAERREFKFMDYTFKRKQ